MIFKLKNKAVSVLISIMLGTVNPAGAWAESADIPNVAPTENAAEPNGYISTEANALPEDNIPTEEDNFVDLQEDTVNLETFSEDDIWDTSFAGELASVSTKGIYEPYQIIKGFYTFDEQTKEEDIVYKKWSVSSKENSGYTEVCEGDSFETGSEYAGMWIRFEVTLKNKKNYTSQPKHIGNLWNYQVSRITNSGSSKFTTVNKITPEEYIFEIDGQQFILLDSTESDTGTFLVLAKDTYGSKQFFSVDRHQSFEELFDWLNTTFRSSGNGGKKLPDGILKYIDYDQGWQTEAGQSIGCKGYIGGISIPAMTEIIQYCDKFGLQDSGEDWWTRSPTTSEYGDGNYITYICGSDDMLGQTYGVHGRWGIKAIRPMFYLSKDFFLDHKLDLEKTGIEVCRQIGSKFEKKELLNLYSTKELEDIFGYEPDFSLICYPFGSSDIFECGCLVNNHTADRSPGAVMVCIYDKFGSLIGIDIKETQLLQEQEEFLEFAVGGLPDGEDEKTVKVFLLDAENGLKPISYPGKVEW